jgi:putative flippase GtrA
VTHLDKDVEDSQPSVLSISRADIWALRRARVLQLLRFGVVGGLGTAVNVLILHLLHNELGWGFTRSSAIATELAIIHNYVWNELWTFHLRQLSPRRLVQYNLSSLLGFGITVAVATVVKEVTDPRLAQLIGILCGAGINYLVNARWTWGPNATPDTFAEQ